MSTSKRPVVLTTTGKSYPVFYSPSWHLYVRYQYEHTVLIRNLLFIINQDPWFGGTFDGRLEELHFKKPPVVRLILQSIL